MLSRSGIRILVVDDDESHRRMLAALVSELGYAVETCANGREAVDFVAAHSPDLLFLDLRMPVLDGVACLRELRERGMELPCIVVTAHADLDAAIETMKLGASDYLLKPVDVASIEDLLEARFGRSARNGARELPELPESVVFESPLMLDVLRELRQVAESELPVLLTGETGTGKEVLAQLVHAWSPRRDRALVATNLAAMPESLVESELFGHVRGAFTGADASREGRFQEADRGTLFLDEVGELPHSMQAKLLRALETKRVARLGESQERPLDFRVISATNRDLEAMIADGTFREDLYYRLAVVQVEVPPLRERMEEVLPLARRFLATHRGRKRLAPAAERALLAYGWPGNIRELQNTMLRAAVLAPGDVILAENLPPSLRASGGRVVEEASSLAELERRAILTALERCSGNRSEAARVLGISRRKLLYRLKEYREAEAE